MKKGPLTDMLVEELETMPPQLKAAARFVLDQPSDVALMSMREQARRVGVSHTTMVRLATWLGLDSYEELRAAYAKALRAPENASVGSDDRVRQRTLARGCSPAIRVASMLAAHTASLGDPGSAEQFLAAAAVLAGSRRLFCLGLRSAHTVARHFASVVSQMDYHAILLDPTTGSGLEAIHRAGPDDVLLGLGFAPYSSATIELVELASRRSVAIVAITDSRASPLARLARESIIVPTKSQSFFQSMAPALSAVEILAVLIAERTGKNIEQLRQAEEQLAAFDARRKPFPIDRQGRSVAA
ncbi:MULTISPECIES: MurR/RpiR family transcriptional regulator [unclassified Mesorhizobium]|uniref:MurR/RpiR family transcriptional regulator n=1 Tax=unclassified Mesorhizobium TaxID=325217 RepID=UPI001FE13C39|nr:MULTISPECIES: MurR/RpiR family transcriptional regulator [unclassified Mesorhizobium]